MLIVKVNFTLINKNYEVKGYNKFYITCYYKFPKIYRLQQHKAKRY